MTFVAVSLAGLPSKRKPALDTVSATPRSTEAAASIAAAIGERQMLAVHTTRMRSGLGGTGDTGQRLTRSGRQQLGEPLSCHEP